MDSEVALKPCPNAELADELARLAEKATPGVWEFDTEYDNDAVYSGGGGCGRGFMNYFIGVQVPDNTEHGRWATLFDSVNSDHKLIEEDYDEDGGRAWDETARCNAALIVALRNNLPTIIAALVGKK